MNKLTQYPLLTAAMIGGLLATGSAAQASQAYSFQDYTFPGASAGYTYINDIANDGTLVGQWGDAGGNPSGFYGNTSLNYSQPSNNHDTTVTGINASGQAVGYFTDALGLNGAHGFVQTGANGAITKIDDLSTAHGSNFGTQVFGINDNGIAVGQYNTALGLFSFTYNTATHAYTDLTVDPASAGATLATGINNNGWIVGGITDAAGLNHGFVYDGSNWTTITDPNADAAFGTVATGINNLGEVVGWYQGTDGGPHGFTYDALTKTFVNAQIDDPNGVGFTQLNGINDLGQVVGYYNNSQGFIATPTVAAVPLPGAVWLFGSALMAGLLNDKRRKALLPA